MEGLTAGRIACAIIVIAYLIAGAVAVVEEEWKLAGLCLILIIAAICLFNNRETNCK